MGEYEEEGIYEEQDEENALSVADESAERESLNSDDEPPRPTKGRPSLRVVK